NGAGKSSTIGIIGSLVTKSAGKVSVFGNDIDTDLNKAKSMLGVVSQEINFSQFEKVLDIVVTQAGFYGIPKSIAMPKVENILKRLSLWDKRNDQARTLSGGYKRRLMIAKALIHEPQLLILDEPTAGVDIELRREMWSFLKEINKKGTTIILTTHYLEENAAVTEAAEKALRSIETKVNLFRTVDLGLDALSLASIYFLAAIGLAITFGVMGVINMAHGEFIMMGAYTGYVIQQIIPDHTISIIVAVPVAFVVTFGAGVAMERLVIRWLYNRPLETLLATFGISIALQQIAKNIFGTQARPLTSPEWLGGSWVINDVVSISYIRIAIFAMALLFFAVFLFIIKRSRLGLETRAVTQNPAMASAMGINPDRVNMLTFGLGSGVAGIAGVAIGLFAKVTSEMGNDYIVQSFMSVVVGGVGNIWGALAGATLVGFMQKGIEWFNPSNTLAAQTYMILFVIIFIQFRPRGIIALKGRAAGD
ncbi:MAG: urea ABC transporter permease subunit UrtB, partial [Alphaproteobacteria bacterium]|nr:urea ABC transporter permease subunit UrtB [Alphaproteobacteria bacterium]